MDFKKSLLVLVLSIFLIIGMGSVLGAANFTVTLRSPGTNTTFFNLTDNGALVPAGYGNMPVFNCSVETTNYFSGLNVTNITLEVYNLTGGMRFGGALFQFINNSALSLGGNETMHNASYNFTKFFNTTNASLFAEGQGYSWNCLVCANVNGSAPLGECAFASTNRTFHVDRTAPVITLLAPNYTAWHTNNTVFFGFVANDSNEKSCNLWGNFNGTTLAVYLAGNGTPNQTQGFNNKTNANFSVITLNDAQNYTWTVNCSDLANNTAFANANFSFWLDATFPVVTLIAPNATAWHTNNSVYLGFLANDTFPGNCSLWGSFNGTTLAAQLASRTINQTRGFTSGTNTNFTALTLNDAQNYTWTVNCTDLASNNRYATNLSFWLDATFPVVTLIAPNATAWHTNNSVYFGFVANDTFPGNCTLWGNFNGTTLAVYLAGNGTPNQTIIGFTSGTNTNFTALTLNDRSNYTWTVNCSDLANNNRFAANLSFRLDTNTPSATQTNPTVTGIYVTDSISYTCDGTDPLGTNDTGSNVSSCELEVTRPDATTFTKAASCGVSTSLTGSDTQYAGGYNVKCRVTDNAGLLSAFTASHAFTAYTRSSGTVSGGGGAGGAGGATAAYSLDLVTKTEVSVGKYEGGATTFSLDGTTVHKITFTKIGTDSVTLTIESTPKTVTLKVGEMQKVDVNDDGKYDVEVKLESISEGGKANIVTKKVTAEVPVTEKPKEETKPGEKPTTTPTEETTTPTEEVKMEEKAPSTFWWWVIGIVVVVIIVWFVMRKK